MGNLEEMDKFLEKDNVPRMNQEEIENMNRPITSVKLKLIFKTSAKVKDKMASQENSIKHLEKN